MPLIHALLALAAFFCALTATLHAIIRRRNPHAAAYWILLSWMMPFAGPLFYYFFGINRIERKALRRRRRQLPRMDSPNLILTNSIDENSISPDMRHLVSLCRVVENAVHLPLTRGAQVTPLINGDEAFPAMLAAIDGAEKSVGLSTYIFDNDEVGSLFIDALAKAAQRGVHVRVLIDDVGAGFRWKSVWRELTKRQVPVAYFMPSLAPLRLAYFNLRDHRKLLTIDGKMAFVGSMNITVAHKMSARPEHPAQDIQFKIEGPVVAQIQETFRVDWHFAQREILDGDRWFPDLPEKGDIFSRGIADGPDEDFEKCKFALVGALAQAKRSVRIVTPYLIPDQSIVSALSLAAMSGVQVDVVLPQETDMRVVSWATQAMLWQILERGVRVWKTKPPFDHAKLMVVDGGWTLFGSTNWDPRSLRLNFEFNVECYGRSLATRLESLIDQKISRAERVTLAQVDGRTFPIKFRDGIARLFSPLL